MAGLGWLDGLAAENLQIVKGLGAKVLCESFVRKFWAKVLGESFGRKFWAKVLFLEPHFESGAGLGWAGLGWAGLGAGLGGWGLELGAGGLAAGLGWAGLGGLGWLGAEGQP